LTIVIVLAVYHLSLIWRNTFAVDDITRIIFILLSYSLLFCLSSAIGRVCMGMHSADAERYLPHLVPAFLGFYFFLLVHKKRIWSRSALTLFLTASIVSAVHLTRYNRNGISYLRDGKRAWKSCYLKAEDIAACDKTTGFKVYPRPEATHMKEKLEYLKLYKLNLYADGR
jgi:hypothetical protein